MKEFKPTSTRIAVFHARHQEKTESGLLYRPEIYDDSLWGAQEIWVYKCGPDCSPQFAPGTKLYIADGSAMVEDANNVWDDVKDKPEFKALKEMAERKGLELQTKLIFEGAALAFDDET